MNSISQGTLSNQTEAIGKKTLHTVDYLFAVLSGILIVGGLQLRLILPEKFSLAKVDDLQGHPFQYLLFFLKRSMLRPNNFSLQCELAALCMIVLILYVLSYHHHVREILWAIAFSAVFSLCVFFGRIFMVNPSWEVYITGAFQKIKVAWFLAAYLGACFFGILALVTWLGTLPYSQRVQDARSHNIPAKSGGRKKAIIYFLIIMVCWLPVFFIFWPGNLKGDTNIQILQYYHFPTRFQSHWISDGKNVVFTNDHPFLQTLILGMFMDLGHALKWNELGVSFYVFLQIVGFGAAISLFLVSLEHFHTPRALTRTALALYCLCPVFIIHGILIAGDSLMAMFFLWFMLVVFWIYKTKGEILHNRWFLAGFVLITFLFCASKNQCSYIVVLSGVLMLVVLRRKWKQVLIAFLLPLFIFEVLYMGLFFRLMHVNKVGSQEALSIFFQQTARTVKYHEDELTEEEKESIAAILDLDQMSENYDPDLADPVKRTFNEKAGSAEMRRYFKTWFKMGLKYPGEYIQSLLDSTWEYYYPLKTQEPAKFYWKHFGYEESMKEDGWVKDVVPRSFYEERWFDQSPKTNDLRDGYRKLTLLVCELPVLSGLACPGPVMWIILAMLFLMLVNKDYHSLAVFFPVLLIFAICLLSPKNGNYRYMLPNSFILPIVAAYATGTQLRPTDRKRER